MIFIKHSKRRRQENGRGQAKVKTSSESRRYRVAGRLKVRAGKKVRQVGTESRKQARVKNRENYQKRIEAGVRENCWMT